jgi:hypothetical protein
MRDLKSFQQRQCDIVNEQDRAPLLKLGFSGKILGWSSSKAIKAPSVTGRENQRMSKSNVFDGNRGALMFDSKQSISAPRLEQEEFSPLSAGQLYSQPSIFIFNENLDPNAGGKLLDNYFANGENPLHQSSPELNGESPNEPEDSKQLPNKNFLLASSLEPVPLSDAALG